MAPHNAADPIERQPINEIKPYSPFRYASPRIGDVSCQPLRPPPQPRPSASHGSIGESVTGSVVETAARMQRVPPEGQRSGADVEQRAAAQRLLKMTYQACIR
jgi:hypothetical protein